MKEKNMKQMRLFAMGLVALMAAGAASVPAAQAADLSYGADIGAFSKYVWRGVEQSNGAAVQGDLSASVAGLTGSVWLSNSYPSPAPQDVAPSGTAKSVVETDWTLDYSGSYAGVGYSIGGIDYTYLYDSGSNFPEIYLGLSYDAPISPSVKVSYTAASSNSKWYLLGDTWVDVGVSGALSGVSLSGTVSFASWKKDATYRPTTGANPVDHWKTGVQLVTLAMSKDFTIAGITATPSLTGTIPVVKKSLDGNRYIYGSVVQPEVVLGVNFSL
jgi:hypothetical protein